MFNFWSYYNDLQKSLVGNTLIGEIFEKKIQNLGKKKELIRNSNFRKKNRLWSDFLALGTKHREKSLL